MFLFLIIEFLDVVVFILICIDIIVVRLIYYSKYDMINNFLRIVGNEYDWKVILF